MSMVMKKQKKRDWTVNSLMSMATRGVLKNTAGFQMGDQSRRVIFFNSLEEWETKAKQIKNTCK
jgi:hypothetical protein